MTYCLLSVAATLGFGTGLLLVTLLSILEDAEVEEFVFFPGAPGKTFNLTRFFRPRRNKKCESQTSPRGISTKEPVKSVILLAA